MAPMGRPRKANSPRKNNGPGLNGSSTVPNKATEAAMMPNPIRRRRPSL